MLQLRHSWEFGYVVRGRAAWAHRIAKNLYIIGIGMSLNPASTGCETSPDSVCVQTSAGTWWIAKSATDLEHSKLFQPWSNDVPHLKWLHRTDGPAAIFNTGRMYWIDRGCIHRTDGPAIVYENGEIQWWMRNHRYSFAEWLRLNPTLDNKKRMLYVLRYGGK